MSLKKHNLKIFLPFAKRRENVLKILNQTYCRLTPSHISGVGVFAIRDIPKDINPFIGEIEYKWTMIPKVELQQHVSSKVMKMVNDFFVIDDKGEVEVMVEGFNNMAMSFYINHSISPNMKTDDGSTFVTIRKILRGEELTVDYRTYDPKFESY